MIQWLPAQMFVQKFFFCSQVIELFLYIEEIFFINDVCVFMEGSYLFCKFPNISVRLLYSAIKVYPFVFPYPVYSS